MGQRLGNDSRVMALSVKQSAHLLLGGKFTIRHGMSTSAQRVVSMGAGAWQNARAFVGRGAKLSAPITAVCGIISDLASTLGRFSLFLFVVSLVVAIVSGLLWFVGYRRKFQAAAADGAVDAAELAAMSERNIWSVLFAFSIVSSVVMGGFVLAEKMSDPDKGAIATVVPGMDKVQEALFRVEKKVDAVKADTTAIREDSAATRKDTARIADSIEQIAKRFDSLAATGGLIQNANTPEAHYHNARVHELGGNFQAARQEYAAFLAFNLNVIDPWQSYATMLKAQEGRTGAIETIRYFGEKLVPKTLAYQTTLAALEEGEPRLNKLRSLATLNPEFGPLPWLISQEYSEARRGDQTIADKNSEKEWLEKFRTANATGRFDRFFLDKKEAQKWIENADARWAKLSATPETVLANPVTLSAQQSNSGWAIIFQVADFKAKELFYRVDGAGDFQSTGHLPYTNPQTGLPMINTNVPLPNLAPGAHQVEVRYVDRSDRTNGPYKLSFSTGDQQLAQGKMMLNATIGSWLSFRDYDGRVLLYFTGLLSYRPLIQEIRYSLNSDMLDKTYPFKPSAKMFEPGDNVYISVPKETQFANVQVTFKDGTKSPVQKYLRAK
jgi:hypothetical protein